MKRNGSSPPSVGNHPYLRKINAFLTTPLYILLVSALTLIASVFSLEIPVYTVFILLCVYICLLGDDLLPLMPIVLSCYMVNSLANNPGQQESTIYATDRYAIYLILLVTLAAGALVWRLVTDQEIGGKAFLAKKRSLLPGMLLLGLAYMLGGLGSPASLGKNLLFGFLQLAVIALPYYIFTGAVKWNRCPRSYFAWIGFFTGIMLLGQLLNIYRINDVLVAGSINRDRIFNGWSMYNNFGILLAMMIPYAFYLASKYNKGWLGTMAAACFLTGTFLTCSRNAILMGTGAFVGCVVIMLIFAQNRKGNTLVLILVLLGLLTALTLFHRQLLRLFRDLVEIGTDNNNRFAIYKAGLAQFRKYPIFGGSFYPVDYVPYDWSTVDSFSNFFPPRWHNTLVQLLASTGIAGLGAYLFHRFQTVTLFLRNRTREKAFIACSILVLLGGSLLDCHFFNFGPVLFYSVGLAFAENCIAQRKS